MQQMGHSNSDQVAERTMLENLSSEMLQCLFHEDDFTGKLPGMCDP